MLFQILDSYNGSRYLYILSVSPSESKNSDLYIYQIPILSSRFKCPRRKSNRRDICSLRSKKSLVKPLLSNDNFGAIKSRFRYGCKYYHCISFPCKIVRAQWGPVTPSNVYSTIHLSYIISSGSFMVLTIRGILYLFIISDGKPYISLSMDVSEHFIIQNLRWTFILPERSEKRRIKRGDYNDMVLWSSTGNSIAIYRIYGINSPNNHIWAHCILPYDSISLQILDYEIVKAYYNYTAYKYCACRVVDIELNSECSANRLVPLTQESDQSHFNSNASSRILPPVMITLSKGAMVKNLLIFPNLLFKSNSTTSVSLYNQLKQISYSVYKISPIIDNFNPNALASRLMLRGYIKSALLLSHEEYFATLVLIYPTCIRIYVLEPLNPFQTLKLSSEKHTTACNNIIDISVLTLNSVSLIALLGFDYHGNETTSNGKDKVYVSIFLLLENLSIIYLHVIDIPSTILPLSHFVIWYAEAYKAILQVGPRIFTIQLASDNNSWSAEIRSHEYTFPNIATISSLPSLPCCGCGSGCENFACALIKFGQYSLLRDFLALSHSDKYQLSLDILALIDGVKPTDKHELLASNRSESPAMGNIDFYSTNRSNSSLTSWSEFPSKLSSYFKDVPWTDSDFEDVDLNMFLGRNGVYWGKSKFASAQFKLLSSVIANCALGAHPFLIIPEFNTESAYKETSSLTYWAIKYDHDVELVKYIISKFSGKDDIFLLLSKLQIGRWINSREAFKTLADWIVKELVIVFRKNPKEEEYFDQLSLWCTLSNKIRLLSSLAKIAGNEKLSNFLLNDFELEEWKSAAEKNAFAAISKQRYLLAISFFLLANRYEDALSISKQRVATKTVTFLLMKFAAREPQSLNMNIEESRSRCPFNKITESDDITMQQLINFSSTFGPHALYFVASYFEIDYFKPILKGVLNRSYCLQLDPSEAYIDKCADLSVSATIIILAFALWPSSAKSTEEALKRAYLVLTSEVKTNDTEKRLLLLMVSLGLWATNVDENQESAVKMVKGLIKEDTMDLPEVARLLVGVYAYMPETPGKFLGYSLHGHKTLEYLSYVFQILQELRSIDESQNDITIARLDLIKRIEWEVCNLVNEIEISSNMEGNILFDIPSAEHEETSHILIVPSGPLAFTSYLPEVNELLSFNKRAAQGLLFRDWQYSLDVYESSTGCSTSCLFTICSLLKKFKGKSVSSLSKLSATPNNFVAGATSGYVLTYVIESIQADATKAGLYKVNVSNTDCFSILHTLSERRICVKLSPNSDRLAMIDCFGWVNIYRIPTPKSNTLCGIHCYTFRLGDHGKSLAWVSRGYNMGLLLVTISGVYSVRNKDAMSLDDIGETGRIEGKKDTPLGQQLGVWLLYTGKKTPRLGLSCGLDNPDIQLNCVISITVNEEPYILLGDSKGYIRMVHIHYDIFRVVYILQCLEEPIADIISCEVNSEFLIVVIGERGNAVLSKCTNMQVDIVGSPWKIVSLVDGLQVTRVKSARLVSSRLLVLLARTKGDKFLLHHTHLPFYIKLKH